MENCPFCHTPYPKGTLFCPECGTYLVEDDRRGTDTLSDISPDEPDTPLLSLEHGPVAIRLSISGKGRQVALSLDQTILLGRLDPANYIFPEVDLTQDDGPLFGVSRRHAKIFKRGVSVLIEDLGSMNGTFVNNRRLTPYMPDELSHGDTLELGRLVIQVLFDEEEVQKPSDISLQERKAYIEERVVDLFELYEGGLCYLEWVPPGKSAEAKSITRLIGEMLPLPHLGATLIGRYPDVGLQLASSRVSGHHCRVFYADYQFFIEDLASTNGTFLNKIKLEPYTQQELHSGDAIKIGDVQLFFRDRLVAFLAELKSPLEQYIVIQAIKTGMSLNFEATLEMLARLLRSWIDSADDQVVDQTVLLIYHLLENTPLKGTDLLLKVVKPGQKRLRHDRVYWALSQLMTQEVGILVESLALVVQLSSQHPLALLHRIIQATSPGPFRVLLKRCEDLFAQGDYSRTDLEQLIGNLKYFLEAVRPEDQLSLCQALFELLNLNTLPELAAFRPPQFVQAVDTPPAEIVQWLQRLLGVSQVVQQAVLAEETQAKVDHLAKALILLNELKDETILEPQKPGLTLYSEILFRWRWIILNERDQEREEN